MGINQERVAIGDRDSGKSAERAIRADDFVVGIGKQMEGQRILGAELLVAVDRVNAHAEYHCVLGVESRQRVLKLVRLNGAAGGHVLRLEVKDNPLPTKAIERDRLAGLRRQS